MSKAAIPLEVVCILALATTNAAAPTMVQPSVTQEPFPILTVTENSLGSWVFENTSPPVQVAVGAGTPLDFSWEGDARGYGGTISAYRFGWNIRNPDNDQEWERNWSPTALSAPTRTFSSGTNRLLVQVRDDVGAMTQAALEVTTEPLSVEQVSWGHIKLRYRE